MSFAFQDKTCLYIFLERTEAKRTQKIIVRFWALLALYHIHLIISVVREILEN